MDCKVAKVTPLFKGGKASDMDNYRPISVLCISSKILERAIHSQLCRFLEENKLLRSYQCGFRKGYSTEFAAISLTDNSSIDGQRNVNWFSIHRLAENF